MRLLALAAWLVPLLAHPAPTFLLPIACEIGESCMVQNYLDADAGPGARDYRCGFLTYDGHKGTDIRVTGLALYKAGVPVLAAAPGRVQAVRDSMDDGARVAGREAGNSVVIDHGEGWVTQYAHLRRGSVAVQPGGTVRAGDTLGVVGLSGATEFPHLHFEVRHRGRPVDPFVGVEAGAACEPGREPLWQAQALAAMPYVATGVLNAGISGAQPALAGASANPDATSPLAAASPVAVFWVQIYGARENDLEELRLIAPDGSALAERRGRLARNRAQWLAYAGKRRADAQWPAGVYRGEYALYRGEPREKVIALAREIRLGAR